MIEYQYDDGGRSKYFRGKGGDCVARAVAIASGMDYMEVYKTLAEGHKNQRPGKHARKSHDNTRTALRGIYTKRKWFKDQMVAWGFKWYPMMDFASGCEVHLTADELPNGRLVLSLSRHYAAVVDKVLRDTYDSSRNGTRCVYGIWKYERVH